jgi:hypothetical protein
MNWPSNGPFGASFAGQAHNSMDLLSVIGAGRALCQRGPAGTKPHCASSQPDCPLQGPSRRLAIVVSTWMLPSRKPEFRARSDSQLA